MVRPVDAGGAAATYLYRQHEPTQLDPAKDAQHVLDTGSRAGRDDYDARMVELAKQLEKGDPLYREQLMREIFKRDPGALKSWLTPERANNMQHAGRISMSEKGTIAEGFAAAYNNGDLPKSQREAGQIPGSGERGKINDVTDLDELVSSFDNNGGDHANQVNSSDDVAQFLEFMNSSTGPEVTEFRTKFSQHLIDQYVLNPAVKYNNLETQQVAGTLVGNLLGATPELGAKNLSAEVLSKYNDDQIKTIIDAASRGDVYLNHENAGVVDRDDQSTINSVHVSDGAPLLIQSVADTHSPAADKAAASIARVAATAPELFEGDDGKSNRWAMGDLFANHSKAILDRLTEYDTAKIGSKDDSDLKQYMQNASELGALFNVVLFNSDQPYSDQARAAVLDYATDLKKSINTTEGSAEAMQRLSMLGGAADDAITQGFNELKADEDEKTEMIGFFVDLAFAGVPIDTLKTKADTIIGKMFDNPHVTEALKGISGQIIDESTGKLTDTAKDLLVKTLGEDEAELVDQQGASNALRQSLIEGITDQRDLAAIENYSEDVSQGINIWRK